MLSYDGNIIAIAAPGATKIVVYSITSSAYIMNVIQGYNPAISSDGKFIGIASANASDQCNIDLFGIKNDNVLHVFTYALSCDFISKGIAITHADDKHVWIDTKDRSYNVC